MHFSKYNFQNAAIIYISAIRKKKREKEINFAFVKKVAVNKKSDVKGLEYPMTSIDNIYYFFTGLPSASDSYLPSYCFSPRFFNLRTL